MSYLRLNYIGKSSLRLVIKENEKKEPAYITKYQYQSKIRQKPSSTPFRCTESFISADHKTVRNAVTAELKSRRTEKLDPTLSSILADLDCDTHKTILRGKETG
jgi:hypothetical protein